MPKPPTLPYDETPEQANLRRTLIENWANAAFWTTHEGVAFAWNLDPNSVYWSILDEGTDKAALPADAQHILLLAERHCQEFERNMSPKEFIAWASSVGVAFHDDWLPAILGNTAKEPRGETLQTKERESLLKMVIGMARGGYGYDPTKIRNEATQEIAEDLERFGVSLHRDTIKKYLDEAADKVLPTKHDDD